MSLAAWRHRWRRWRERAPADRRVLVLAWFELLATAAWLRLRGFERRAWVYGDRLPVSEPEIARARHLGTLVNIAARQMPVPASCLSRSLVLSRMLHRRGIAHTLQVGVRMESAGLEAHAWVECGGVPVNDAAGVADRFGTFRPGSVRP